MFKGYTDGTLEYFMALAFNNNTEFFHDNHDWYLKDVREPSLALAAALSDTIEAVDDSLERRPNRVVSRLRRDLRFSRDKTPYREYILLTYKPVGERPSTALCLYFDLSARFGIHCGIGLHGENRAVTDPMRERILADPQGLLRIVEPLMPDFELRSTNYKRMKVPPQVPEPLHVFYTTKGFYLQTALEDWALVTSPRLLDALKRDFMRLAPFYRFFRDV